LKNIEQNEAESIAQLKDVRDTINACIAMIEDGLALRHITEHERGEYENRFGPYDMICGEWLIRKIR